MRGIGISVIARLFATVQVYCVRRVSDDYRETRLFDRLLQTLVSTIPCPPPESGEAECAPPVPFTEADNDPTEEMGPPTMPSPLNADAAFELANKAVDAGKYGEAKAYLRYADMYAKGECFVGRR